MGRSEGDDRVHVQTSELRGYAESLYRTITDEIGPALDRAAEDIIVQMNAGSTGFTVPPVLGTSGHDYPGKWIGETHSEYGAAALEYVARLRDGLVCVAKGAACLAEDFTDADQAGADDVSQVFTFHWADALNQDEE